MDVHVQLTALVFYIILSQIFSNVLERIGPARRLKRVEICRTKCLNIESMLHFYLCFTLKIISYHKLNEWMNKKKEKKSLLYFSLCKFYILWPFFIPESCIHMYIYILTAWIFISVFISRSVVLSYIFGSCFFFWFNKINNPFGILNVIFKKKEPGVWKWYES